MADQSIKYFKLRVFKRSTHALGISLELDHEFEARQNYSKISLLSKYNLSPQPKNNPEWERKNYWEYIRYVYFLYRVELVFWKKKIMKQSAGPYRQGLVIQALSVLAVLRNNWTYRDNLLRSIRPYKGRWDEQRQELEYEEKN